jgi:AraC-like DNA-binding protein
MSGPDFGRGVLRPDAAASFLELRRHPPAAALARVVEFYWNPRWDLRGRPCHEQKVLAHPNVHLVWEEPEPTVYGVQRGVFTRVLRGRGQAFGVKFRPGAFRPFARGPVAGLADRTVPAADLFGAGAVELGRRLAGTDDLAEMAALVERITASPQLFRVDALARELDVPVRRLQRLFAEYVGASPKWVLRRARLHEAAARAEEGAGIDWAALAADLGYADQSHLTRDFTAATGTPPARYAGR